MKREIGFSVALFLLASASALGATDSRFHELGRYKLGGEGSWDYLTVDSGAKRLYIARSSRVMVVDTETGKLVGEVADTQGVHGIALDTVDGIGFASDGAASAVTAFDLKTLKPLARIAVGENPDAILFDPATMRVFAFNGKSHDVSVIDASTLKPVGKISLDGKPEFAAADGQGAVFVNLEDVSSLVRIDAREMKVAAKYPLNPCEEPTGLSMDPKSRRLFVGCGNKLLAVVDADSGSVLKTLPVGSGVDATAFDPRRGLVFVSAGEGKLSVVKESSPSQFEPLQDVATQKGARTLAVDPVSGRVFLVSAAFGPPVAPVAGKGKVRPSILPGSFVVIVMGAASGN